MEMLDGQKRPIRKGPPLPQHSSVLDEYGGRRQEISVVAYPANHPAFYSEIEPRVLIDSVHSSN